MLVLREKINVFNKHANMEVVFSPVTWSIHGHGLGVNEWVGFVIIIIVN